MTRPSLQRAAFFVAVFVVLSLMFSLLPGGIDWYTYFRPAAANLAEPFAAGLFNPPWLYVLLAPLVWLPPSVGRGALAALTFLICYEYIGRHAGRAILLALSPPFLAVILYGQVDAVVILGLALPVWASLPFLLAKPQGAFLTALHRLNWRSLVILALVVVTSFLVWGAWPVRVLGAERGGLSGPQNKSLFPWSLVLVAGLPFYESLGDASLCLISLAVSPYFAVHSMLPLAAATIKRVNLLHGAIVVVALWVFVWVMR